MSTLREKLAEVYEGGAEWKEAAKCLMGIPLDSGHRYGHSFCCLQSPENICYKDALNFCDMFSKGQSLKSTSSTSIFGSSAFCSRKTTQPRPKRTSTARRSCCQALTIYPPISCS